MGLEVATLTAIASASTTAYSISQNRQAQKAQKRAGEVQAAQNKAQEMEERRRQIREERIKRARVEQASTNTGTAGSSGELGAVGGLATNLNANVGANMASVFQGGLLSAAAQDSADAQSNARMGSFLGQLAPTAIGLGASIFSTDNDPIGTFINQYESKNK